VISGTPIPPGPPPISTAYEPVSSLLALVRPTVTIRTYNPTARDGVRQRDLAVYRSAQFTRQRNSVGTFEIQIPLVPTNAELLENIREGWLFEFWSEAPEPQWLFGGYVTYLRWSLESEQTVLTVRGLSYLGWLGQRRIVGGTGSLAWAATLGGLETPGDPPAINEIMYHALTYNPWSVAPPGTAREHPSFRIPNNPSISDITDDFSPPNLPADYALPRLTATEITAYMSGIEVMNYLTERVGDRVNEDPTSVWFGMPRISYDIIRYTGDPFGAWPTNALYLVLGVPGLGVNRTVGNADYTPVIFDVDGGGVSVGEYIEDSSEVKNFKIVLGDGEKATRSRYDYSDGDSITRYGLIEDVIDAGQEGNVNVIEQKARDSLNDTRKAKVTASFTLAPLPGQVYGYDFFFDDVVTVYWSSIGLVLNDFVTSVTLSMGAQQDGSLGIQQAEVVVGSEKLARRDGISLLGRYLSGVRRGLTNLRV
jgi:hypothetical protein